MRYIIHITNISTLVCFSTSRQIRVCISDVSPLLCKLYYLKMKLGSLLHCIVMCVLYFHRHVFVGCLWFANLGAVDVNVTPDKRKIFVDYESYLLAAFKVRFLTLYLSNLIYSEFFIDHPFWPLGQHWKYLQPYPGNIICSTIYLWFAGDH